MSKVNNDFLEYERIRASQTVMDLFFTLRSIKRQPTLKDLVKLAKRLKYPGSTHVWGNWPDEFFNQVGNAAVEIGEFCRRWGRISVTTTKEKYGTARVYCHFGIHQMFSITHPGYVYSTYPPRLWKLDCIIMPKIFHFFRINRMVIPLQQMIYRYAYKRTLQNFPLIRNEILDGADYPEYLRGL